MPLNALDDGFCVIRPRWLRDVSYADRYRWLFAIIADPRLNSQAAAVKVAAVVFDCLRKESGRATIARSVFLERTRLSPRAITNGLTCLVDLEWLRNVQHNQRLTAIWQPIVPAGLTFSSTSNDDRLWHDGAIEHADAIA